MDGIFYSSLQMVEEELIDMPKNPPPKLDEKRVVVVQQKKMRYQLL